MRTASGSKDYFKQAGVDIGQGKYHEEMVYGLALMYRTIFEAINDDLKKYELTPGEMNVLMLIKHRGQDRGFSQIHMGRHLMVTAHNMTRLIQRLERGGLVRRSTDQKDGRVNLVKITPKGAKLLDDIWPSYDMRVREMANKLTLKDQADLARLIKKWLSQHRTINSYV